MSKLYKLLLFLIIPLLLLTPLPLLADDTEGGPLVVGYVDKPAVSVDDVRGFRHVLETNDLAVIVRYTLSRNGEDTTSAICNPFNQSPNSTTLSGDEAAGQTVLSVTSTVPFETPRTNILVSIEGGSGSVDSQELIVITSVDSINSTVTVNGATFGGAPTGSGIDHDYTTAKNSTLTIHPYTKRGDGDWDCYSQSLALFEWQTAAGVTITKSGDPMIQRALRNGAGLVVFYLEASEVAASGASSNDSSTVFGYSSAAAFDTPQSTPDITVQWCAASDCDNLAGTKPFLEDNIVRMLEDVETADPTLETGDLVSGGLVTLLGAQIWLQAFPAGVGPIGTIFQLQREVLELVVDFSFKQDLTNNEAAGAGVVIEIEDASVFETGQEIAVIDDNSAEVTTITAVDTTNNTITATLVNSYTTAANAFVSFRLGDILQTEQQSSILVQTLDTPGEILLWVGLFTLVVVGMTIAPLPWAGRASGLAGVTAVCLSIGFFSDAGVIDYGWYALIAFILAGFVGLLWRRSDI